MFPGPGLGHLIVLEAAHRGRDRPLATGGAQPHVHLIEPAGGGRGGYGGDHCLGQARVIGPRRQRAAAFGCFLPVGVIDHDQVQIRPGIQLSRPQRPHPQHHRAAPRRRTVTGREFVRHDREQGSDTGIGQIGILQPGLIRIDQPAQVMHADAEMPFMRPGPGRIQRLFVTAPRRPQRRAENPGEQRSQPIRPRPGRKERPAQNGIEYGGMARQIGRQPRRRAADIDDQFDQGWVGLKQRKQLHPGGQAGQKTVEPGQRFVGMGGARHAVQQFRLDPFEDLARAARAQRRIGPPAVDDRARLGRQVGHCRRLTRGEEAFGQFMHAREPRFQPCGPRLGIAFAHHVRDDRDPVGVLRDIMRLGVVDHLDAVFDVAMFAVMVDQFLGHLVGDPVLARQRPQPADRVALTQIGVAAAGDQLARLGEEFDLADTTTPQLDIMARHLEPAAKALVVADPQPHVMGVLNGRKIQMPPPDKGAQFVQKPFAGGQIACAGACLDECGAFPGAALGLVIGQRGGRGDADGRDGGVRTQPQIGAKDIAMFGHVRQRRGCLARRPDQRGAGLGLIVGGIGVIIEQHDQIDIR